MAPSLRRLHVRPVLIVLAMILISSFVVTTTAQAAGGPHADARKLKRAKINRKKKVTKVQAPTALPASTASNPAGSTGTGTTTGTTKTAPSATPVGTSSNAPEIIPPMIPEAPPVAPPAEFTPETPPSTSPSTPGLLFSGSKISDFHLDQSAPGAITEVPSPTGGPEKALQMTVNNNDVYPITPTENPRAQLLSPDLFEPGDEFWWHSKFFLPANFPSVPGWMGVMEGPYGPPFGGPPPFSIQLHGEMMQWQRNGTYNYDVPWQVPMIKNSWVEMTMHCQFSSHGFIELWINGEPITFFAMSPWNPNHIAPTKRLNMATEDSTNDGGANFAVIQSYRQANILSTVSLFQGPMLIGNTKESVEA